MRRSTAIAPALLAVLASGSAARRAATSDRLPRTSIPSLDPSQVTVSGISSGGFFAHQCHVAYSELVSCAGVMAGGPYACAEQTPSMLAFNPLASVFVALGVCTRQGRSALGPMAYWLPQWPSVEQSLDVTKAERGSGQIDDPAYLANDRVWLFVGANDEVVPRATPEALRDHYLAPGLDAAAVRLDHDPSANHGVPIEEFTGTTDHAILECHEYGLPFLIDCGFDAAERLLRRLHPAGFTAEPGACDRRMKIPHVRVRRSAGFRHGRPPFPVACRGVWAPAAG